MFLGGQKLHPYIPMAKARGFTGAVDKNVAGDLSFSCLSSSYTPCQVQLMNIVQLMNSYILYYAQSINI